MALQFAMHFVTGFLVDKVMVLVEGVKQVISYSTCGLFIPFMALFLPSYSLLMATKVR